MNGQRGKMHHASQLWRFSSSCMHGTFIASLVSVSSMCAVNWTSETESGIACDCSHMFLLPGTRSLHPDFKHEMHSEDMLKDSGDTRSRRSMIRFHVTSESHGGPNVSHSWLGRTLHLDFNQIREIGEWKPGFSAQNNTSNWANQT